jgi:formylmethanofuran dehydrogenase subunit B
MDSKETEAFKKKITELEQRIAAVSYLQFSYIQAILGLLEDKELTNAEEFQQYLAKHKVQLAEMMKNAEFVSVMQRNFQSDNKPKAE